MNEETCLAVVRGEDGQPDACGKPLTPPIPADDQLPDFEITKSSCVNDHHATFYRRRFGQ